jgi:acyl carrier protein
MDVENTLEQFIVKEILLADPGTRIDYQDSLIENGVLDSLSLLRLINFLEDQFGVLVGDDEVLPQNFQSITQTAAFVRQKQQG